MDILPNQNFLEIDNSLIETNNHGERAKGLCSFGHILGKVHRGALELLSDTLAVHHRYRNSAFAGDGQAILEGHYKDMFLELYEIEQLVKDTERIAKSGINGFNYMGQIEKYRSREPHFMQAMERVIMSNQEMIAKMEYLLLWAKTIGHHKCEFFALRMRDKYKKNIKEIREWMSNNKSYKGNS